MKPVLCAAILALAAAAAGRAAEVPPPIDVERQPFAAATGRLVQALEFAGSPLSPDEAEALQAAMRADDDAAAVRGIQRALDARALAVVRINAEGRVSVEPGPAPRELVRQGWRSFLVKVWNEAGVTAPLRVESPNALPVFMRGRGARERPMTDDRLTTPADVPARFLDLAMADGRPLTPELSGLAVEYRILQLYSRDEGEREATLSFHAGQGSQDLGFRSELPVLFRCLPCVEVKLGVRDESGEPVMAAFTVRDSAGRIYPNPSRRLAPDFFFHHQVYRADGESLLLPTGDYRVTVTRGPEYRVLESEFKVPEGVASHREEVQLNRWIHPKARGWYSGDHHVHAAGCAHYDSPTEGVGPADMMRHILGEDLNVGCVLSWGPCWYSQKEYFEGKTSGLSVPSHLMRYDIEVSGFPSSHAGHLCLLRLKEDDYPGTTSIGDWPSWTLPVLAWGRKQGGISGYSHSGWGLALPDIMPDGSRKFRGNDVAGWIGRAADKLPDNAMPPFDGIGANEFIVTGPAGECDFISAVDTPAIWELNIWYHMLNCGIRTRISGETDFPCIYGERVGLGRSYVKLPAGTPLDFDAWIDGIKAGRSYCGDGMSHLFDFRVAAGGRSVAVGEDTAGDGVSRLDLAEPGRISVTCDAAALLAPAPTEATERIRRARLDEQPYWNLERCRIGDSREVEVELVVNGNPVATRRIVADGGEIPLTFEADIARSSWVALRILPAVHTNPVWIRVGGKPVRASRASAEWCRRAVDVCWNAKSGAIREAERPAAREAYDAAARYYDAVLAESP